jgi:hypothetical protein
MCVILLKPSDPSKTGKSTAKFVSVQHSKVGKTNGQLSIRAISVPKHEAMTRTVHWFQGKWLVVSYEGKHVFFVVLPMS